jgi:two-component system nitrate/nitrite response regulator NarL
MDVVLLALELVEPTAAVRALRNAAPQTKIVALATAEAGSDVVDLARAGVSGYVTRDASLDELVDAIEGVCEGEARCSPRLVATLLQEIADTRAPAERVTEEVLTPRERQIVGLLEQGLTNKEIAGRLTIELPTVKNHVHRILGKLHLERRAEAAAWARRHAIGMV